MPISRRRLISVHVKFVGQEVEENDDEETHTIQPLGVCETCNKKTNANNDEYHRDHYHRHHLHIVRTR